MTSDGSRGGALGNQGNRGTRGSRLFWVKIEEIAEGRKAPLPSLLTQGLDSPLICTALCA